MPSTMNKLFVKIQSFKVRIFKYKNIFHKVSSNVMIWDLML